MRIPFLPIFMTSPFDGLLEHAEKVRECVWAFQQAIECYASEQCKTFQEYHQEVDKLESEADAIKASIRGHMPLGVRMPVSKFQLFMYINEQDKVCDSIEQSLGTLSNVGLEINRALVAAGIEVALPNRDVRIRGNITTTREKDPVRLSSEEPTETER